MNYKLRPYQEQTKKDIEKFLLDSPYKKALDLKPVGCHSKGYKVFMADGSLKNVEDIKIGDKLMGPDSKSRRVIELYNGKDEFYKLTLKNIEILLNKDHVLHLVRTGDNYKRKSIENQFPKILNVSIIDYLKWTKNKKSYYKIKRCGFSLNSSDNIYIEPYYFGLWLGDGSVNSTDITTDNHNIKKYLREYAERLNLEFRDIVKKSNLSTIRLKKTIGKTNPIIQDLKKYNVSNNKHIPELFLKQNDDFRLEILNGIIDSDGYKSSNVNYEITLSNYKLSKDIYRLCGSLGYNPIFKKIFKKCKNCENKSNRTYYKVSFRGDERINCKVEYKKIQNSNPNKNNNLYSFNIEKVGIDDYYGFNISGDNLYICENFIIHHNSGKSLDVAIFAKSVNNKCLVIQPRKELLEQNLEKARNFGLDPSVYSASKKSKNISDLTYATSLSLINNPEAFKDFDYVVIDEAHMGLTNSIKRNKITDEGKLVTFLNQINPKKILGLTATPIQLVTTGWGSELKMINRSKRSYWYQSDIIHVTQISEIKEEYWADLEFIDKSKDESLLELNSTGSDFKIDTIIKQYDINNTFEEIINNYEDLVKNGCKSVLIFVPSVKQALDLKKRIKGLEVVYDKLSSSERTEIIQGFKKGDIKVIANVDILSTGFDEPKIDGIIIARNTNSLTVFYQQCGRGVRPIILKDGTIFKKKCKIIDLTGNTKRFGNIENISIEKQDYTKGWAMWSSDKILTGYIFGDWETPSRKDIINAYNKTVSKKESTNLDIKMPWGKHKGESLKKSIINDRPYFIWLLNNKDFEWSGKNNIELKKNIENIIFELTINQI